MSAVYSLFSYLHASVVASVGASPGPIIGIQDKMMRYRFSVNIVFDESFASIPANVSSRIAGRWGAST